MVRLLYNSRFVREGFYQKQELKVKITPIIKPKKSDFEECYNTNENEKVNTTICQNGKGKDK